MDAIDEIVLPESAKKDIEYYKKFGEEFLKSRIRGMKAVIYVREHLVLLRDKTTRISNCFSSGTLLYGRKDGNDITDLDVAALMCFDRGQTNRVQTRTDKTVGIYYECDSGE
jgi:hypothetical protein